MSDPNLEEAASCQAGTMNPAGLALREPGMMVSATSDILQNCYITAAVQQKSRTRPGRWVHMVSFGTVRLMGKQAAHHKTGLRVS